MTTSSTDSSNENPLREFALVAVGSPSVQRMLDKQAARFAHEISGDRPPELSELAYQAALQFRSRLEALYVEQFSEAVANLTLEIILESAYRVSREMRGATFVAVSESGDETGQTLQVPDDLRISTKIKGDLKAVRSQITSRRLGTKKSEGRPRRLSNDRLVSRFNALREEGMTRTKAIEVLAENQGCGVDAIVSRIYTKGK